MQSKFEQFGGQYVPETLMAALGELECSFKAIMEDEIFKKEYMYYLNEYVGRPSPLYLAKQLTRYVGGPKIYLKREDLNHTGAHKINNVIGQLLLAKKMGKKRVIAETGAGQHGVATATGAALFGMECVVFMGEEDIRRQALNVFKIKMLGAKVVNVTSGTATLKDATNEAIREWVRTVDDTYYVIGSVVGPHPYPTMVRSFQKIIGEETREQILAKENKLPHTVVACVGGGSNAAGMFCPFIHDKAVNLVGVEAAGKGVDTTKHAATITKGSIGVIHGMKTYLLQDHNGNIDPVYSISAGLDYPGIGPEHAYWHQQKRVTYHGIKDDEAVEAFQILCRQEGIIPALESSHAVAYVIKHLAHLNEEDSVIINLSGRGDKDVGSICQYLEDVAKTGGDKLCVE